MPVKSVIAFIAALLLLAAGGYYYCFYPPALLARATQRALDELSQSVATKDRVHIGEAFQALLTDRAHIRLEVSFFTPLQQGGKPVIQEFDKPAFMAFIDNILYSLQDYSTRNTLQEFSLSTDKQTAHVVFTLHSWGDGLSYYGGISVNVRFNAETVCDGDVAFEGKRALLGGATCKIEIATTPKPGEESKLHNPETIRELFR